MINKTMHQPVLADAQPGSDPVHSHRQPDTGAKFSTVLALLLALPLFAQAAEPLPS